MAGQRRTTQLPDEMVELVVPSAFDPVAKKTVGQLPEPLTLDHWLVHIGNRRDRSQSGRRCDVAGSVDWQPDCKGGSLAR